MQLWHQILLECVVFTGPCCAGFFPPAFLPSSGEFSSLPTLLNVVECMFKFISEWLYEALWRSRLLSVVLWFCCLRLATVSTEVRVFVPPVCCSPTSL